VTGGNVPETEAEIEHAIRLRLGREPGVVIWRNSTGVDQRTHVRYGLCVGSSDLIGIVTTHTGTGRFLALEVKRPHVGQLSTPQRQFLRLVNQCGGYGACVRSVEDALMAVERARR
jgi:hypothetical protein